MKLSSRWHVGAEKGKGELLALRRRQPTLGNVTFAHGPHIVARAAPRLNPAQSTLHIGCGCSGTEPLSAARAGGFTCSSHTMTERGEKQIETPCVIRISYLVTFSGGTLLMSFHALRMLFLCAVLLVTELKALKNP